MPSEGEAARWPWREGAMMSWLSRSPTSERSPRRRMGCSIAPFGRIAPAPPALPASGSAGRSCEARDSRLNIQREYTLRVATVVTEPLQPTGTARGGCTLNR
eukprot:525975-Prorocentrum_minimum.AAC.1